MESWLPKESSVRWLCFPEQRAKETAQHVGKKLFVANESVFLARQRERRRVWSERKKMAINRDSIDKYFVDYHGIDEEEENKKSLFLFLPKLIFLQKSINSWLRGGTASPLSKTKPFRLGCLKGAS